MLRGCEVQYLLWWCFKNEKIIIQIVRLGEVCDQNADRMCKKDKSCNICLMNSKGLLAKHEKYGLCLYKGTAVP